MVATNQKIEFPNLPSPELFFGFVAPIGTDIEGCIKDFTQKFQSLGYRVIEIKVTDIFKKIVDVVKPTETIVQRPYYKRYSSHIAYGNQLRSHFGDDAILAAITIGRVIRRRLKIKPENEKDKFTKTVFLLHQLKRKEEIDLLRSVYGRLFFQVSVYSRRGARVEYLSRRFAASDNSGNINKYRSHAENVIQRDENESEEPHGQRVSKIFHDGDFIVNLDIEQPSRSEQIDNFCDLLFGSNKISPNKTEYGMFIAKAAALRTLDLSRQVGAAIFSDAGEVLSMGSNEVPKGLGGTYWCDDPYDDREYARGVDSNDKRKREILSEIVSILGHDHDLDEVLNNPRIRDSQFMDALEYGRIIHAEMSAISDAARLGRALKDSTLYCTTFPCHMCAKHIVAAGIQKVVFLEPYPKSLASEMHIDSLSIEGSDRGRYQKFPAVEFSHFHGVSPRRYRELFERGKRKEDDGTFREWRSKAPTPIIEIKLPFYVELEAQVTELINRYFKRSRIKTSVLEA
jgi:deoxycytidylate deaminase